MFALDFPDDDGDILGCCVDGGYRCLVQRVDKGPQLFGAAAPGDGNINQWHGSYPSYPRMTKGSATGPSSVLIQMLLSRVYSYIDSMPCSIPTPEFLKPWRGDIGDIAR